MSDLATKIATIDTHYSEINDLTKNNTYKYVQINENTHRPIVVGSMCNDEYNMNSGYLETIKYWDVEDTVDMCFLNAQKVYTDMKWEEENLIHSDSVVKQPGLSIIEKSSNGHLEEDVQFFKDSTSKGYISDFNVETKANTSVDLFGYFLPNITGTWTFSLPNADIAQLWITNDRAIYDYTTANANINSNTSLNNNIKQFSIKLKQGEYYPIRIQIANLTSVPNTNAMLNVLSPNQDVISKNSPNHNYFVSLLYNGEPYMKKLLYFALYQSEQKRRENRKLFQCVFVNPIGKNYDTIKRLKVNEPKIFRTSEVPTKITYQSAIYNVSADQQSPVNIASPVGSNLQVSDSRYGLIKDRVENQPIPYTVPETDPAKIIKQDYYPYTYKQLQQPNQYRDASGELLSSSFVNPRPLKTMYKDNWVTIPSSKDTTSINRSMIKGNQLNVNGDFNSIYGDPAPGYNDKNLSINYKYTQVFDVNDTANNITNKNIYLDASGQLVIGYDYNGTTNSSVISILNNTDKCVDVCNYVLKLKDNGVLAIYNNQKLEIWHMRLADLPNSSKILSNNTWLNNPQRRSILNRGEKLSPSSIPELISDNGKFKLKFENGKLVVKYTSVAYNEFRIRNSSIIRYTENSIKDNGNQIYYLYRINASGLNGKKFLSKTNKSGNINDNAMWYLQNNSNKILKFSSYDYNKNISRFPLLSNAEYDTIINTNTKYNIGNKYSVVNISENDCKTSCQNNVNCDHFFYMNTSTGGKCIEDIASSSKPMFSYINPNRQIQSSHLGNKKYNVYTDCGNNEQGQSIPIHLAKNYSDYNIMYNNTSVNDSKNTYYCAEDKYIKNNQKILDIYTNKSGFATMEGMTTREGVETIHDSTINTLLSKVQTLQDKQRDISNNYITSMNAIDKHKNLTQILDSDFYKSNDYEKQLFSSYENELYDFKPDTGITDGIKRDTNTMILQQNTLYTVGTITAATLLIFAILLARD